MCAIDFTTFESHFCWATGAENIKDLHQKMPKSQNVIRYFTENPSELHKGGGGPLRIAQNDGCAIGDPPLTVQIVIGGGSLNAAWVSHA